MFERLAVSFADQIKKANPEETAPHDVLVFGFTILFNVFFTFSLLLIAGWLLGIPLLMLQVALSFMILRILTGGGHLDKSMFCSITSLILVSVFAFLPSTPILVYGYFFFSLLFVLLYAPYYEAHQVVHSPQWERKKKGWAILWIVFGFASYHIFNQPGFLYGSLLQGIMITPIGIVLTHKLNKTTIKGGECDEKNC